MEEGFAGWNRWAYLVFFLFGYALADDGRVRAALRRLAVPVGVFGLVLFAGTAPGFLSLDDPFTEWGPFALVTRAVFGAAGWCWVVAILGLLDRPHGARPPSRVMAYLGLAALPLYVLHQPVVVALAYGVVGRPAPIVIKYVVIVAGSLAVLLLLYEFVVRRTRLTRFLFGMRSDPPVGPSLLICFAVSVGHGPHHTGRSCGQMCSKSRTAPIWCTAATPTG
ncbi:MULTISPECIES: acyltransferase family protein [unclassified Streptomyces]|uniref:acyltransferase family protein n=1 Tax=unclassified Streptomyces TaxID=2593676 RepID=UPI0027E3227F|nr:MULTISPECIES: acyltransferase family protein [unclassified Streptomyces]